MFPHLKERWQEAWLLPGEVIKCHFSGRRGRFHLGLLKAKREEAGLGRGQYPEPGLEMIPRPPRLAEKHSCRFLQWGSHPRAREAREAAVSAERVVLAAHRSLCFTRSHTGFGDLLVVQLLLHRELMDAAWLQLQGGSFQKGPLLLFAWADGEKGKMGPERALSSSRLPLRRDWPGATQKTHSP